MQRYRLDIEYDGSSYCGWQRQNMEQESRQRGSIQYAIEKAIYAYKQEVVNLTVAGRTDAGVHAMHQVANFDLTNPALRGADEVTCAINAKLAENNERISILSCQIVDKNFSARFDAKKRIYLYSITLRKSPLALDKYRSWHIPYKINIEAMEYASTLLCGQHDFSSFRSSHCQAKNPIRFIDSFEFLRDNDKLFIKITALSFLHNQVRSMIGSLYNVGRGKWEAEYIREVLAAKNRTRAGQNAPAYGLYLYNIVY